VRVIFLQAQHFHRLNHSAGTAQSSSNQAKGHNGGKLNWRELKPGNKKKGEEKAAGKRFVVSSKKSKSDEDAKGEPYARSLP
jgi:hypothetical protein